MEYDASAWSGEGAFTRTLLDALASDPSVAFVRVEDAPASREDSSFSFISNEIFVGLARRDDSRPLATLAEALERVAAIGAPDYADDTMLQYLRVERVVPPYQTRGVKVIEMVRVYQVGKKG